MTAEEAKQILLENRPNRPRKTEQRKLQKAIDVAVDVINSYETVIELADIRIVPRGS